MYYAIRVKVESSGRWEWVDYWNGAGVATTVQPNRAKLFSSQFDAHRTTNLLRKISNLREFRVVPHIESVASFG